MNNVKPSDNINIVGYRSSQHFIGVQKTSQKRRKMKKQQVSGESGDSGEVTMSDSGDYI